MKQDLASGLESHATKREMASRAESKAANSELCADMRAMGKSLSRWILICFLWQTAMLAGLGYFALTHLQR